MTTTIPRPAGTAPLLVEGEATPIGALSPAAVAALAGLVAARADGYALPAAADGALQDALDHALARLLAAGLAPPPRREAIDVRTAPDAAPLARIDRSAAEPLGLLVTKVCLNGIAEGEPPFVWLARRGPDQRTAPGLLDTTVAGAVAAGDGVDATLAKEAREEAGFSADLIARARRVARLSCTAPVREGLVREDLVVFDLALARGEVPRSQDDEIAGFERLSLNDLAAALVTPRDVEPGAAVVLRDLLGRRGIPCPLGREST